MFIRVRDKSTGHEFDVPETDPRVGEAFERVSKRHYPPSSVVRRPKHKLRPATGGTPTTDPKPPSDTAEKEA